MIKEVKKTIQHSTPTRYNRVLKYIHDLKENVPIKNQTDKEIVDGIEQLAKNIVKKVKIYARFNLAMYIAIYFSFISFFFTDIFIISELATIISRVVSVFGTTIFIFAIYFSQKIMELYYQDLSLITSHLIAIYTKHQKENIDELGVHDNYYSAFIKFFEERYPEDKEE